MFHKTMLHRVEVDVVHVPADNEDLAVDLDNLPVGGMYVHSDKLVVRGKTEKDRRYQEITATGRVTFRSQDKGPSFYGTSDEVKFDEATDKVIFIGNPATLCRIKGKGVKPDIFSGQKIIYNRRTGECSADRVSGITSGGP